MNVVPRTVARKTFATCVFASLSVNIPTAGAFPQRCSWRVPCLSIAWVVLGLIAGFIGSKIVNKSGEGLLLDIVLGVVGAVVGGFIFNFFGAQGITGVNIYSIVVAVIGAVVVLWVYHATMGRRV